MTAKMRSEMSQKTAPAGAILLLAASVPAGAAVVVTGAAAVPAKVTRRAKR